MQRWISILAVVLGLQVVLALALGLGRDRLAPTPVNTPLVTADLKSVDRLLLDGPASGGPAKPDAPRVEFVKRDGRWLLPGYHDAPADATRLQAVLDRLGTGSRGFPVARTADASQRFKVAETDHERRLVASTGDKAVATVYLGQSPGLRKVYARSGQEEAVYVVELSTPDLPVAAADWLDGALLKKDAAALTEITITAKGKPPLTLTRAAAKDKPDADANAPWQVPALAAGRSLDAAQAGVLTGTLATLRVDGVLGKQARPEWQQDAPDLTLGFKNLQGQPATWTISKVQGGDSYVLKASDQPWYLELKAASAQPLLDAATPDKLVVAGAAGGAASVPAAGAHVGAAGK
jgi:hypothetical protein